MRMFLSISVNIAQDEDDDDDDAVHMWYDTIYDTIIR